MNEKKYEEMLPYTTMLLKWLDMVGLAIIQGNTGSIELSMVHSYLTPDLKKPIAKDIEEINEMYAEDQENLKKLYSVSVGHPSNNEVEIVDKLRYKQESMRLEALANQMKVNKIMDALHKNGMLLTSSTSMPTSVVG